MRKQFVLWIASLALATGAWAADQETGKVVSIDPTANTFTIQTDAGDRIVFRSEASTELMREGTTVRLSDLRVGTRVEVTAPEAVGTSPRTADRVEMVAANADRNDAIDGGGNDDRRDAGDQPDRIGNERAETDRSADRAVPAVSADRAETDRSADRTDLAGDRVARNDRLPNTASPLPLIGLLGAGGVLAGMAVRSLRR